MSAIKMVALDLDGTTLNSKKRISPRTINAFQKAMEEGVHIVISTGRTFHSLPKQLFQIKGLEYVVTSNGAHITKLENMERMYENYINPQAVEKIVDVLRNLNYSVETFVKGKAYIDKEEYDEVVENGSSFRDAEYIISTRNPIPHIFEFMLDNKNYIENISINFPNEKDKSTIESALSLICDITLTSSFVHNIEIGGSNTSKGEALKFLMKKLNVKREELMACGDSPNDGAMLDLAGIGVVVGNGHEEMKKKADYITDTNDNDGVAKAIEKFAL